MPWVAAALLTVFLAIAFPIRALIQRRRFGDHGRRDRNTPRPPGAAIADVLFGAGFAILLAAALLDAAGALDPAGDPGLAQGIAGSTLVILAAVLLWRSQEAMGPAWRPAIAPIEGGRLVRAGPFAVVRNPNYTAMLAAGAGAALLTPSWLAACGWLLLLASLMLTARLEETLLESRFGDEYREYAARVGRFVPGMGKLRAR